MQSRPIVLGPRACTCAQTAVPSPIATPSSISAVEWILLIAAATFEAGSHTVPVSGSPPAPKDLRLAAHGWEPVGRGTVQTVGSGDVLVACGGDRSDDRLAHRNPVVAAHRAVRRRDD